MYLFLLYSRTRLLHHLRNWRCGRNVKKMRLSEYKETFENKIYQIYLLNYFKYYF
jgi:hypothetical protein